MARESGDREARRVRGEGVGDFADWLAVDDRGGTARLCTMVGALALACAARGFPLSEEILTAARDALRSGD